MDDDRLLARDFAVCAVQAIFGVSALMALLGVVVGATYGDWRGVYGFPLIVMALALCMGVAVGLAWAASRLIRRCTEAVFDRVWKEEER